MCKGITFRNVNRESFYTHLTFPPQYWHWGPCQPSWHTHVPFTHTPLPHSTSLHLSGEVSASTDTVVADTGTGGSNDNGKGNSNNRDINGKSTATVRFRRYLDLNRNRNMSTAAFMTCGGHALSSAPGTTDSPRTLSSSLICCLQIRSAYACHRECPRSGAESTRHRLYGRRYLGLSGARIRSAHTVDIHIHTIAIAAKMIKTSVLMCDNELVCSL